MDERTDEERGLPSVEGPLANPGQRWQLLTGVALHVCSIAEMLLRQSHPELAFEVAEHDGTADLFCWLPVAEGAQ
jgi:hypothetical protein